MPIPAGSIRKLVRARQERFNDDVTALAGRLYRGEITLRMWESDMRTRLRLFHTGCTAIGAQGWEDVTPSQWGRTGAILKEQYRFLHGFAQDIFDRREYITEKSIAWRARLYGAKGAYTAGVAQAGDLLQFLPYMPKDGSTTCLNGCKCHWSLTASAPVDGVKQVTAVWTLMPAEHCEASPGFEGCVDRNGVTVQFEVLEGVRVPARLGGV
jgi:hypothetical protein